MRSVPEAGAVDLRPVEGAAADADLGTLAKALGHPTRVRIIRILRAGEGATVSSLVETLALAQSTVSEHLRILRDAGLIQGEFEGPRTRYCVNSAGLAALRAGISAL